MGTDSVTRWARLPLIALVVLIASCGGEKGAGPEPSSPVTTAPESVKAVTEIRSTLARLYPIRNGRLLQGDEQIIGGVDLSDGRVGASARMHRGDRNGDVLHLHPGPCLQQTSGAGIPLGELYLGQAPSVYLDLSYDEIVAGNHADIHHDPNRPPYACGIFFR